MCEECQNFIKLCMLSIGCAIYFYLILYLYFLTIDLAAHCVSHASKNIHTYTPIFSTPIFNNNSYVNMNFLLTIVYSICLKLDLMQKSVGCDDDVLDFAGACRKMLKRIHIRYENKNCKLRICTLISDITKNFICSLNIMLIIISNPSLLNPGPVRTRPLTILYKNVQGLINTNDLASETPPLNMTKLLEFHGYLYTHKSDILILNETWLKNL